VDKQEIRVKVQRYCAYQERCTSEVLSKLKDLEVEEKYYPEIIKELRDENFLNDARFAVLYAGGKFRIKKWGRNKIIRELEMKGIRDKQIEKGLKEIGLRDYSNTLKELIAAKERELKHKDMDLFSRNYKVSQYLIRKGYEPDLIWKYLKRPN
jgi:regulatory protein